MPAKDRDVRVVKMRNSPENIHCEWLEDNDKYNVTFHDQPLPAFYNALKALPTHVCALAELPGKDADKIEVTGITVTYRGEDCTLATLVAKKQLKRSVRVLNLSTTPLSIEKPKEETGQDRLSDDEAKAVKKLIQEVRRYILGERSDPKLFAFAEAEKAAEEAAKKKGKKDPAANVSEFPNLNEPPAAASN